MIETSVFNCRIIKLPRIQNRAGNITHITNQIEIPFNVKRIFYIYDIPGGVNRGAHSHKECHQFLIAVSGSFRIELNDGVIKRTIMLNRPYLGLYIPPGIWSAEKSFSSGAICLVLASDKYNESDYIRDYSVFLKSKKV
jgi:hypothetical protein